MNKCIKCGATEDVADQIGRRCLYPIPCLTRQLAAVTAERDRLLAALETALDICPQGMTDTVWGIEARAALDEWRK